VIHPKQGSFFVNENSETKVVLTELLPNQQYFLRVALHIRDGNEEPDLVVMSEILTASTPPVQIIPILNDIEIRSIDVKLTVDDLKSSSAFVSWRFFTFNEKQFIDGVQIRFTKLVNGYPASGVPGTTPFIHRDTNFFLLEDLLPDTEYQVDLYLIPVPKAKIELTSGTIRTFKTLAPLEGKKIELIVLNFFNFFVLWTNLGFNSKTTLSAIS
jgi:hypothetical protein